MDINITHVDRAGDTTDIDTDRLDHDSDGWNWIDITVDRGAAEPIPELLGAYSLDPLALHDAFNEIDSPKFDDFGDHVGLVLHGVREGDRLTTYDVDCFITSNDLITIHPGRSGAIEALRDNIRSHPELASGGAAEVAARVADGLTRRLLAIVDAFDERADGLVSDALVADRSLLHNVAAVRADLAAIRRIVHPQREALDLVRTTDSPLVSPTARRRFSDVFDVASRTAQGLDAARTILSEAVDAYRGAEARSATEVSKVLTIYAAVLLPLSLIVGFFGMNHTNLPTIDREWGWVAVTVSMIVVVAISVGVFVSQGWIGRPSGKTAGATLGRGLAEAARTPAQVASAAFTISSLPIKSVRSRIGHGESGVAK